MRENKYIKGRLSADYTLFSENDERNRLSNSDLRILMLLAATALLCFGGLVGCALYRMPGLEKNTLYDSLLERYFTAMFSGCATPWDVLLVVTKCVFREILRHSRVIFFGGLHGFHGISQRRGSPAAPRIRCSDFASYSMLEFTSKTGLLADAICLSRRIFRCLNADGDRRGAGVRVLFPTEKAGNQEPRDARLPARFPEALRSDRRGRLFDAVSHLHLHLTSSQNDE